MNMTAVEEKLPETLANNQPRERPMEFTYKSGARPLEGYTIKRGLGWGGFGEVYFAISDGGKEVALKLVQRHLDVELRGVAQCLNLKNSNLVCVHDVRRTAGGENWIVMEYIAGESLLDRLGRQQGPIGHDETIHWLTGIANAIDYLHENGVVHRDLKPGNVFSEAGHVKVGDYGLSKFISASRRSGQTQSVGTVHYMAPEISTGNYGPGVDVYSAGVIAFEMLCGDVPFDGETAGEILMKHLTAEPAIEKLPQRYRKVFAKVLSKTPDERYRRVGDLLSALHRAGSGLAEPASHTAAEERTTPPPLPDAPRIERPAEPTIDKTKKASGKKCLVRLLFWPFGQVFKRRRAEPELAAARGPHPGPSPTAFADPRVSLPPAPGTFAAGRRAASDLLWSMFTAGLLSLILPILTLAVNQAIDFHRGSTSLATYQTVAVLTGISSWGVVLLSRWWERWGIDAATRRLSMLVLGLIVGALALGMHAALLGRVPGNTPSLGGATWDIVLTSDFRQLHSLLPVASTFMAIFALAYAIPDWAKNAFASRASKFSIWRVIWPTSMAIVVSAVIANNVFHRSADADPLVFLVGGIVALTAIIVQWVTPIEPDRQRRQSREWRRYA